jgi:iron transport multicopper oxidase
LEVDSIKIFVGQRYSFVLKADHQQRSNYWVRALPDAGPQGFEGGINSAILRYDGALSIDPKTMESVPVKTLNETDLHPLDGPGEITEGPADINKTINFEYIDSPTNPMYMVNNKSFEPPTTYPILLQVLNKWPQSSYILPPNKIIELTIPGIEHDNPVSDIS